MELSSLFGICVINIPTACTKVSTVPINHCVRNMNLDITKTVSQVVLKKIMKISFGGGAPPQAPPVGVSGNKYEQRSASRTVLMLTFVTASFTLINLS